MKPFSGTCLYYYKLLEKQMVNKVMLHIFYYYFWGAVYTTPVYAHFCLLKKMKICMDNPSWMIKNQAANTIPTLALFSN